MSDYQWVSIRDPADYDKLSGYLDPEFEPNRVVERLKLAIRPTVCGVLIESDYVDKDYRSAFYHYYAKKGRAYRNDCVRLHFFDANVSFDEQVTNIVSSTGSLEGQYFGFIVLRPTFNATIGRSILSPDIRDGARGTAIQAKHRVHLLGHTLYVWGFPSMSQHVDISVCAHVSCWTILRHYSERFAQISELLLHDITMLATPFDPGGLTPALGLDVLQAERIFQAAGTYPLMVVKRGPTDDVFYAQMLAYLESGFPLFIAMDGQQHAVVAAGYAWKAAIQPQFLTSHAWEQVESILTVDDNLLPYVSVGRDAMTGPAVPSKPAPKYTAMDFSAFIVPLPEKIFYSALAVERLSRDWLYDFLQMNISMPPQNQMLRRYFATTVSALRRFAREKQSQFGDELVNMFMRIKTAQFVWVVEYASRDQWSKGHIAARAIIDATASPQDPVPVWFAHGEQVGIFFDRDESSLSVKAVALNRPKDTPLGRMEQNLRPIRP